MPFKNSVLKFGIAPGCCTNKNEIQEVTDILPDKNYKVSVGDRNINPEEIGLLGLNTLSYLDIKTIFNTFIQSRICQEKSVSGKNYINKFSVVQEWIQKGKENEDIQQENVMVLSLLQENIIFVHLVIK